MNKNDLLQYSVFSRYKIEQFLYLSQNLTFSQLIRGCLVVNYLRMCRYLLGDMSFVTRGYIVSYWGVYHWSKEVYLWTDSIYI